MPAARSLLLPVAIFSGILFSCNSKSRNSAAADSTATATTATTGTSATAKANDPDPADSVPDSEYDPNTTSQKTAEIVRTGLKNILKNDLATIPEEDKKFIFYETDLNDDGKKEIFVGFRGMQWCGTGGCSAYLLSPDGKLITRFSVVDYPFAICPEKTNGWKNLVVRSGNEHLLKFDGKKYPGNPSLLPEYKGLPNNETQRALGYDQRAYPWFTF